MYEGIENDHISKMIDHCKPLGIKVELKTENSELILYLDGRESHVSPTDWDEKFGGFREYMSLLMHIHKVKCLSSTKLAENYYSANLGTLFDMIRNVDDGSK